jgi:hypothetical protein
VALFTNSRSRVPLKELELGNLEIFEAVWETITFF